MAHRDDLKDRVLAATNIVDVVGQQLALRPKGREFVGLCPFHDDKSPSMYVNPAKQIFKCFACGAGGSVFDFVMRYHKMEFKEALHHLAERAGIPIEEQRGGDHGTGTSDRKRLAAVNGSALDFFRTMLLKHESGQTARDYIARRGISPEMVTDFQLGYAPDSWDGLATVIQSKKLDLKAFEMAGLVKPRNNGQGHFDILRHRLIFPICDALGRPIAFGGRKLREEDEPKYLNSPETPVFNKSRTLYGLHLAKKPIIDSRTAVIVEGYVDVIACHQAGFRNVVATLGTALTAEHVTELRRYAEKVVLIFDADAAGERAADRAVELFLTGEVDVAIAELPQGPGGSKMDPGELLFLEEGPDLWRKAVAEAADALQYQFDRVKGRLEEATTVTGRQRVAQDYITRVGQLGIARTGAIRRSLVIQRLSGMLHMTDSQIDGLLKAAAPRVRPPVQVVPERPYDGAEPVVGDGENNQSVDVAAVQTPSRLKAVVAAERQLIGCLLKDNRLFTEALADGRSFDEAMPDGMVTDDANRRLYQVVYEALSEGREMTLTGLLAELAEGGNEGLAPLATECDQEAERIRSEELRKGFAAAAGRIIAYHAERDRREERDAAAGGEDATLASKAASLLEPLKAPGKPRVAIFRAR